jgi:rubredoxin
MNQTKYSKTKNNHQPKKNLSLEKTKNENQTIKPLKIPYECPHCSWIIRKAKPDHQHPIPSTTKPNENITSSDILIQNQICRNPRCQKSFPVFWFKSKDFYNRI